MDDWLHSHMAAVLLGIEIVWVGGVVAVFLLYFVVKWYFSRAPRQPEQPPSIERPPPDQPPPSK